VNLSLTLEKRAFDGGFVTSGLSRDRVLDNLLTLSLTSPNTSKNGTQYLFGNIQIPLLEHPMLNETADSDGWLYTTGLINMKDARAALFHAAGLEHF
jgi:hypothetical protein